MNAPACPKCKSPLVGRTHRNGMTEQALSLAYVYPFKCQVCQHRFRRLRWGERYVRVHLDRRDTERLPTRIPVTIHWKDGGQGQGTVRDISVMGCGIETEAVVPMGALVLLQLEPEGEPPIDIDVGEVRSRQPRRIGVRFARVAPTHSERIRQIVQRLLAARPT
jgi:PilZ domain-containing protein